MTDSVKELGKVTSGEGELLRARRLDLGRKEKGRDLGTGSEKSFCPSSAKLIAASTRLRL